MVPIILLMVINVCVIVWLAWVMHINKFTNDRYQNLLKITAINMFVLPMVFDFSKIPDFKYFLLPYALLVLAGCYSLIMIININKRLKNIFSIVTPDGLKNLALPEKEKYIGATAYIITCIVVFAFGLINIL